MARNLQRAGTMAGIREIEKACALLEGLHSFAGGFSKLAKRRDLFERRALDDLQHAEAGQ